MQTVWYVFCTSLVCPTNQTLRPLPLPPPPDEKVWLRHWSTHSVSKLMIMLIHENTINLSIVQSLTCLCLLISHYGLYTFSLKFEMQCRYGHKQCISYIFRTHLTVHEMSLKVAHRAIFKHCYSFINLFTLSLFIQVNQKRILAIKFIYIILISL